MLERNLTKVAYAASANLNGAANTALLTFVAAKPIAIHRFGVIAAAAEGLLSPMRLKCRITPAKTGTVADIAGAGVLDPGGARARGIGVFKTVTSPVVINAGDTVTVTVDTAAGATSTGHVFLEYGELPFAGNEISAFVASA